MSIGENIKNLRKKAGITQQELADRIGIPFQSISQWECGKRNPKYITVIRIAEALECNPNEIFFPVRTNADKVRAMSDEEMAVWLDDGCPEEMHDDCKRYDECWKCWLAWLRNEATE